MDEINLATVDLNLLVALDALLEEQHVTRAAHRLGLSQPAMSNALGRLRALFEDPLLVRAGSAMRRTPRADVLWPTVRTALSSVRDVLAPSAAFAASHASGTLTIAISDYVGLLLVPSLAERVARVAPGLSLRFIAHGNRLTTDALADGVPRVSLGFFFSVGAGLRSVPLLTERFACVLRPGDLSGRLTRKRYLGMSHVLVSQRGAGTGYVDRELARSGETRRVSVIVPHFLAAASVVARSGGIATLPSRTARLAAQYMELEVRKPPLPLPEWPLVMVWHGRFDADGESRWLRSQIEAAAESLIAATHD